MEFYEVITQRKSVRKFKPDLVDKTIVTRILDAARIAPTWANMQGVKYIVVNDKEKVEQLKTAIGQKWLNSVPMFIVAIIAESDSGKNKNGLAYFMVDVGICFEHLLLAATNEGLGTCWIGYFDEEGVKNVLDIKKKYRVVAITPLGYADEVPKQTARKNLEDIAFINKYGDKYSP